MNGANYKNNFNRVPVHCLEMEESFSILYLQTKKQILSTGMCRQEKRTSAYSRSEHRQEKGISAYSRIERRHVQARKENLCLFTH